MHGRPQITLRIEAAIDAFMEWWDQWGLLLRLAMICGIVLLWSVSTHPRDFAVWVVLPLVGLLLISTMRRMDQRRYTRRVAENLCPFCGYDLRATPDRCPECGNDVHTLPAGRLTFSESDNQNV